MELVSFYILIRLLTEAMASTESGPRNLVVLAGQRMTINCNPGQEAPGIDWYFVDVGGSEEIKLSSKSQIFTAGKDFSVDGKIPGESLTINSTELKHAGQYICTTLMRQENKSRADVGRLSAEVIVLESDPECHLKTSTVKERDNIEMWCIVKYSGKWSPVIEWREINGNIISNAVLTEATNSSLISTLNVSADAKKHNSSYLCQIYFTGPQNQTNKDIADNINPDYNYTWTSPLVHVLYGPRKTWLTPQKNLYSEGDEVVCSAEANPSPRFEWKILENNVTFDGPVFAVRSDMTRDDSFSIQCTAINDATALQAKSNIAKIELPVKWSTIKILTILFAVFFAVLVFVVLIVIQNNIKEWIAKACRSQRVEEREENADIIPLEVNQHVAAVEGNNSSACMNVHEHRKTGENSKLMSGDNGNVNYLEMNASGLKSTAVPPAGPSLFSMSIYATIDHTLKVPPPPPQERYL